MNKGEKKMINISVTQFVDGEINVNIVGEESREDFGKNLSEEEKLLAYFPLPENSATDVLLSIISASEGGTFIDDLEKILTMVYILNR